MTYAIGAEYRVQPSYCTRIHGKPPLLIRSLISVKVPDTIVGIRFVVVSFPLVSCASRITASHPLPEDSAPTIPCSILLSLAAVIVSPVDQVFGV